VVVEVPVELHGEELRGDHEAELAVPLPEARRRRVRVEVPPRVLVEADRETEVELAGADRLGGRGQRTAGGGAAVGHVDELQAGEAELVDEGVGGARALVAGQHRGQAPAVRELQVAPLRAGIGQGLTHGVGAHRRPAHPGVAPERVDPDPDDGDVDGHAGGPKP
jgi:hypothetical protein